MKSPWALPAAPIMLVASLLLGVAACADDGGDRTAEGTGTTSASGNNGTGPDPASAAEGRDIAARAGCGGCHGINGEGGIGPSWVGLAGSQVALEDGTTVVADAAYLTSSIKTPDAQVVAGDYSVAMPVNQLADADIAKIVAYIESLASSAPPPTTALTGATAPTIPIATAAVDTTAAPG